MDILSQHLVNLLPPAVALGVLAYFTRFFGKVIADQNPFSDDREWHIELSGIMFMVVMSQGVVGIAAAVYGPALYSHGWMHIVSVVVIALASFFSYLTNAALSQKFFQLQPTAFDQLQENKNEIMKFFRKVGMHYPPGRIIDNSLLYCDD